MKRIYFLAWLCIFISNAHAQSTFKASWINGTKNINDPGIYWSDPRPSKRLNTANWQDDAGNLWLMGGYGRTTAPLTRGTLSDLWRYDIAQGTWTWMSGTNTLNAVGVYGTKGLATSSNMPGGRVNGVSWSDTEGNLWLVGGSSDAGLINVRNDLWRYNIATDMWTWVGGDNTPMAKGVYGRRGMGDTNSKLDARAGAAAWKDDKGSLWLMGGFGFNELGRGELNDLWRLDFLQTFYADEDKDGFGNAEKTTQAISIPPGFVTNADDCNDLDATINPNTKWYLDEDGDGYYTGNAITQCSRPGESYRYSGLLGDADCNDSNPDTHPGAEEIRCNYEDDDCDGLVDEPEPGTKPFMLYLDEDEDGYGTGAPIFVYCPSKTGMAGQAGDCNDNDPEIHPFATEHCNGIDDDCDGLVDENLEKSTWYRDEDGDGYGDAYNYTEACDQPNGYVANMNDCDDADASLHTIVYAFADFDQDGYFGSSSFPFCKDGYIPEGFTTEVPEKFDCNDENSYINPGATESCNDEDDDCDGNVDNGVTHRYYEDEDQDGYGNPNMFYDVFCPSKGWATSGDDCDDSNPLINPAAEEICNGVDDNCNGVVDEGCQDGSILSFTLVNAQTDKDIAPLKEGDSIDLGTIPGQSINIRANYYGKKPGSVVLELTGPRKKTTRENGAPFTLFSNKGTDYFGWTPLAGHYTLTATPYSGPKATGVRGLPYSIYFNVIEIPRLKQLTLVNTTTGRDIGPLTEGMVIDLTKTPDISIRADAQNSSVASVRFALNDKPNYRTESKVPFAIAGDVGGKLRSWDAAPGNYVLSAQPFTHTAARGQEGPQKSVTISIIRSAAAFGIAPSKKQNGQRLVEGFVFKAFPSPTASDATLLFQVPTTQQVQIQLVDGAGKLLQQVFAGMVSGGMPQQQRVHTAALPAGVYFCRLMMADGRICTIKLVKQ